MKRVLVIGHRGMLGSDLMQRLAGEPGVELEGADRPDIDIRDPASVTARLGASRPEVVINCAGWTAVDDAETHRDEAMRVNGAGAGNLARAAASLNARIVHLSTDYVFDGRKSTPYVETDEPRPLSVYGESKLEGERQVAALGGDWLIVRSAWLYGAGGEGKNFVTTVRELAAKREELTVVDDQRGSPTWTRDLVQAIWELCRADARGIVHAAGGGSCTWCEFAREIVRRSGLSARVRAIRSDELGRPAKRPANSVLDTSHLGKLTGFRFPDWRQSLALFLKEYSSRADAHPGRTRRNDPA